MRAHLIDDSCGTLRSARMNRSFKHTSYEHFPAPICFDPVLSFSVEAERLREALAKLSSEQRGVIESAYFEGLSQTEISERMKIPLGTVKTWARRGPNLSGPGTWGLGKMIEFSQRIEARLLQPASSHQQNATLLTI